MTNEQAIRIGERVVELLGLRKQANNRYGTTWGDKTELGLGACIARIVEDEKEIAS